MSTERDTMPTYNVTMVADIVTASVYSLTMPADNFPMVADIVTLLVYTLKMSADNFTMVADTVTRSIYIIYCQVGKKRHNPSILLPGVIQISPFPGFEESGKL